MFSGRFNSPQNVSTDEVYNVILNSNDAGGSTTSALFNFDWSILPDRSYQVHYSFNSSTVNTVASPQIAMIYSDMFSATNTYVATNQAGRTTATTSNFLGVAYPYIVSTTSTLHAEDSTSAPIFIQTRPNNNQFTITIQTNASAPTPYPSLPAWVLVLQFVPYDKTQKILM